MRRDKQTWFIYGTLDEHLTLMDVGESTEHPIYDMTRNLRRPCVILAEGTSRENARARYNASVSLLRVRARFPLPSAGA